MNSIRRILTLSFVLFVLGALSCRAAHAQAALLMEEPYGFFGAVNPTGHNAIYFQRICAETPVKLRRCQAGEMGAVIARYEGIAGYDWVAIPLIPYLYSVESASEVPSRVDRDIVARLRSHYREEHLQELGPHVRPGGFFTGGWTQLIGVAYERRIYAFRFETTAQQDDAVIERLNAGPNASNFNLLFNNCADFARVILNGYFPRTFKRSIFPDAGMTTPKQIAYKLTRYARKHPETGLAVFEISQVPGYRRLSHSNRGIDESLITLYAIPIAIVNPYLVGGLFVDDLFRGNDHIIPKHHEVLGPDSLAALTPAGAIEENSTGKTKEIDSDPSATSSAPGSVSPSSGGANGGSSSGVHSTLIESNDAHE